MTDALGRILGLKAKLNLHIRHRENKLQMPKSRLDVIGCDEHIKLRKEGCKQGITLVKDTQNLLPISTQKNKRDLHTT